MKFSRIYNPMMKSLLRSPLHGLISKNIMVITFTGRRSGKTYSTPVNYIRDDSGITVFSRRAGIWWRNLRGGASVTLRVRGKDLKGIAESIEDMKAVMTGLSDYLQKVPSHARYFKVTIDPTGQPNPQEIAKAPQNEVLIRIRLVK